MEPHFQGAESKVYITEYLGKTMIVKERFNKKYRNEQLDRYLIAERTKAEIRNIVRCKQAGIKTPALYFVDLKKNSIYMEYFQNSTTTKHFIDSLQSEDSEESKKRLHELAKTIGENLGKMHQKGILHGDLTTSNMLLVNGVLVFIDFGLSSTSSSPEDKAVDLYVLEKALISTHSDADKLFVNILDSYKKTIGSTCKEILMKFEEVRARGRKRLMVG